MMEFSIALHVCLRIASKNSPGAIIFTLTAAQLVMEVMVTDKGITLNSLQGGASNPNMLSNVIGSTMKLDDLIKLLRDSACDIFPDDDSFCYTESSCEKNYVMEMHIYSCMASFALSVNFSWSRWNFAAGSRTCVFLMRELLEMRKLVSINTKLNIFVLCRNVISSAESIDRSRHALLSLPHRLYRSVAVLLLNSPAG